MLKKIVIKGAKEHNLKNISLEIPKDKFVVITGLSGSGKSSLAFDTIYAEGQRRYVESLSSYARQFMGKLNKPKVDKIIGISTGTKRSISQIESILRLEKNKMQARSNTYDDLSEIYSAIESSLGWGLVLEPELNRVITTADRTYFDITE